MVISACKLILGKLSKAGGKAKDQTTLQLQLKVSQSYIVNSVSIQTEGIEVKDCNPSKWEAEEVLQ